MERIFTRYLWGVVTLVLFVMLLLNFTQQTRYAQERMRVSSESKFEQIAQTLRNNEIELKNLTASLREDYLTRARAFAYIIEQNPAVLEKQGELERIKKLLNVDELHVIDGDGFLRTGTIPKYYGMDFRSTEQTAEFLDILENPEHYLVQDIRPNGAENKIFQYIGVARQDKPGIVQIGLAPNRILEARSRNELSYILSRIPVEEGGSLFVIDAESHQILSHTNEEFVGKTVEDLGYSGDYLNQFKNGGFRTYNGERTYVIMSQYDRLILGMGCVDKQLYKDRGQQMFLVFACLLLTSLFMIFCINALLKKQIVSGIHQIMEDLLDITKGNLSRVVKVENNPEFIQLSASINKMVQSILDENVKVSKIMDMVDIPIGVFEFPKDGSQVMATDRLRQILSWNETEASYYYQDKELFIDKLAEYMKYPEREESEIYKIDGSSSKWVQIRIHSDAQETFGVITDVTAEVNEKRRIKRQRDYDALTGLSNIMLFKKRVEYLMRQPEGLGVAAMVMLDLDHFKSVNDKYGHEWGDNYLKITANLLSEMEDENIFAARRSGDEFCLFFYSFSSRATIRDMLSKLFQNFKAISVPFPDSFQSGIGISSGVAWHDESVKDFAQWMRNADNALYDAKNNGRGIICEF